MHLRRIRGLKALRKPRPKGATAKAKAAARRNIRKAQIYRVGVSRRPRPPRIVR